MLTCCGPLQSVLVWLKTRLQVLFDAGNPVPGKTLFVTLWAPEVERLVSLPAQAAWRMFYCKVSARQTVIMLCSKL